MKNETYNEHELLGQPQGQIFEKKNKMILCTINQISYNIDY